MDSIKISVIVPVYNTEQYLRECLDSLVGQTWKNLQIILVDDGSTDKSSDICKEYEDKYKIIEYHYKNNGGTASARNFGLKFATGDYIGFIDSDDWIDNDLFFKLADKLSAYNFPDYVVLSACNEESSIIEEGYYTGKKLADHIYPNILPLIDKRGKFRVMEWSNCTRLFKRDLLIKEKIEYCERTRRCEDLAFAVNCSVASNSCLYISSKKNPYHYRPCPTSKSRHYTNQMYLHMNNLSAEIDAIIRRYNCEPLERLFSEFKFYCLYLALWNEARLFKISKMVPNIKQALKCENLQLSLLPESYDKLCLQYKKLYNLVINKKSISIAVYIRYLYLESLYIKPLKRKIIRVLKGSSV